MNKYCNIPIMKTNVINEYFQGPTIIYIRALAQEISDKKTNNNYCYQLFRLRFLF